MAEQSTRDRIAVQARRWEREGEYQRALAAWERLAEHDPGDGEARTSAARVRRRIAQLAEIAALLDGPPESLRAVLGAAIESEDHWFVVQVRRGQLARRRGTRTLVALAGALRRSRNSESPAWQEAEKLLQESAALDSSKTSNAETHTTLGALYRARGELTAARKLLEEVHALNHDEFSAAALAAVYLDLAERGGAADLDRAKPLIDLAYARSGRTREVESLYRRYDALVAQS